MNKKVVQAIIIIMVILLVLPLFAMPGLSAELPDNRSPGVELFEQHCAGCHLNGGNIVRRGKTLKQKAMAKNGYTSIESIADLIINGKGNMSAYGDRLSSTAIQTIAEYVFEQSQNDWKP